MKFIPFAEAKKLDHDLVIGVDCFLPGRLNLSHWRGAGPPPGLAEDTSAAIVINALEKGAVPLAARFVTNNHFDVDGFTGIWSLLNPQLALENKMVLKAMALLGDFRELSGDESLAQKALKLVAWLNTVEKREFYAPFGRAHKEEEACVAKYEYFLEVFGEVLKQPDRYKADWEGEFNLVQQHRRLLEQSGRLVTHDAIRLMVVHAAEPLHYYALFGSSSGADMVLSIYPGNRYELEYKYTTWVDAWGRTSFPRISFQLLIDQLNALETSGMQWTGADVTDTGPILRLGPSIGDKEIRFDHPFNRPFYSSSISSDALEKLVVEFYQSAYAGVQPREIWTWSEVRRMNSKQ